MKPQEAVIATPPAGLDTRTVVGVGARRVPVPVAQEMPTNWLSVIVERASDLGTAVDVGIFCIKIPPKTEDAVLAPLVLTVVFLMSNPAPSRRMPPAVLLLTVT